MRMLLVIQASQVQIEWKERLFGKFSSGRDVICTLIERLISANQFHIVIATSSSQEDVIFKDISRAYGIDCIRGEQRDIVSRLRGVVNSYDYTDFIRVSAYSPLVDIQKLVDMYHTHIEGGYDYSFNEHFSGVPMGMGGDIISGAILNRLEKMGLDVSQKEFMGLFIRQSESVFKVQKVSYSHFWGGRSKLTIETRKDFDVVNEILEQVTEINVEKVAEYLDKHHVLRNYNQENPPREVGVEKLFLNEKKVNAILSSGGIDVSYPISVELTLTNACNLKCVYCSDLELRNKQGVNQIGLDVFCRLIDDLANGGTRGIVLEGGGEPTLYPHFAEVVRYARSVGLAVGLITNGTRALNAEVVSEMEWIRVSLDASTREEYVRLKGVDVFENVLTNIAKYVKHCDTVGIGYVVTNNNISQLESLVLRLRMMGASYIQLRPVVDSPELFPQDVDLSYLKYYENSEFAVNIEGMKENAERGNDALPCYAHSITSIISGDGSVYICGRLNIYEWLKPIGNIREKSFRRVWYSEERQNQAEKLTDAEFCRRHCPQCRISKFNKLFYRLDHVKSVHFI